jgi:hypothetical protein
MTKTTKRKAKPSPIPENKVRVTLLLPKTVDRTVELCAALENLQKTEIVTEALKQYLRSKGYDPDKLPTKTLR